MDAYLPGAIWDDLLQISTPLPVSTHHCNLMPVSQLFTNLYYLQSTYYVSLIELTAWRGGGEDTSEIP
jgi:hypothetical protein